MKKTLLSLATVTLLAPAALADTVTLNSNDATNFQGTEVPERPAGTNSDKDAGEARHYQPLTSLTIGDFGFTFTGEKAAFYFPMSTKPDGQKTIRVYADNTMTITAPAGATITSIDFKGASAKNMDKMTASTGTLTVEKATSTSFNWTGETDALTLSFAGTYRVNSMEVTYTIGGTVLPATDAPTFSKEEGGFTEPFALTLSAAEGAKIYYTLDGSQPSEESDLYESPISITKTTTVKAVALEEGKRLSPVASATYTLEVAYNTLDDFIAAGLEDQKATVKFAGKATVVYQNGQYLYLEDGTTPLLAFGKLSATYQPGDVITGFAGSMTVYQNLNELKVKADTFGEPVEKVEAPQPVKMDVEDVTADDQNKYIWLEGVTINAVTDEETQKTTYTLVDTKDADIIAYPRFTGITFPTDGKKYNVYGLVSVFKEDIQIFPTEFVESVNAVDSIETSGAAAVYFNLQGLPVAAPAEGQLLIKVQDGKATKVIF